MINKVFFQGNLTRNPDFRNTPAGSAVCTMTVAHNRKSGEREETTFIDVTVWGKSAEYCRNYLVKGSPVLIEGRLTLETWQGRDGQNKSKVSIISENIQGLNRGDRNNAVSSSASAGSTAPERSVDRGRYAPPPMPPDDDYNPQPDDDMPF